MPNVRDYFKAKEKRQPEARSINYRERIRSHKLTIFYRIVLTVLLTGAIIFGLYIQWRDKTYTECIAVASSPISIVSGTQAENLAGNILIYSKDGASCIDTKGNVIWNQTYEMQNPMISICQGVVAIGDYNGRTIYVMNAQGSLGQINTNMPIRYFSVAANGEVAVVLDDSDITWIHLFALSSPDPIAVFKTSMDKFGYPVSVSITPNGKLVAVSYLYVDSGVMKSSVAFYNFGTVGANVGDNYMSGYNYLDTIVPYIKFMNNDSAFGISDDRIMFFEGGERPLSVKDNLLDEEIRSVYHNEDYVGLVFNNTTGESTYRLDVYDKKGNLITAKNFDFDYTDIIFFKDCILIYNDLECMICNVSGAEKFEGIFNKPTALIIPTDSITKYITVTSDSIDVLELK